MVSVPPPPASAGVDPFAAALQYAARGWPVLPLHTPDAEGRCSCHKPDCKDVGKHPRTLRGLKDASLDPVVITGWWRKWPNANVGLRTGARSGIVVLDVDAGTGGRETLVQLVAHYGPLPPTLTVETGGGGIHLVFAHPGVRVTTQAGQLGPGLDVRGDGGYIVAPPSLHRSGRRYQWVPGTAEGRSPAPLPPWIVGRAARPAGSSAHLADEAPILEGQRNTTLTSLAGKLRHDGLSERAILAALLVVNEERCDPPLDEREVTKIAQSIARYPVGPASHVSSPTDPQGKIAHLRAELDDARALNVAVMRVVANPHLREQAVVALRIAMRVEQQHVQEPSADGYYRVSERDIAYAWNPGEPIRGRATIGRAKQKLNDWGLFAFQTRWGSKREPSRDYETGEITTRSRPERQTWIRWDKPLREKLEDLARFERPELAKRGGRRSPKHHGATTRQRDRILSSEHGDAQGLTISRFPMPQSDAEVYVTTPRGGPAPIHHLDASWRPPIPEADPTSEPGPP